MRRRVKRIRRRVKRSSRKRLPVVEVDRPMVPRNLLLWMPLQWMPLLGMPLLWTMMTTFLPIQQLISTTFQTRRVQPQTLLLIAVLA